MLKYLVLVITIYATSCSTRYYVVRHAEKETATNMMSSDVPLSAEGNERADALKEALRHRKIQAIYSTNYIRTKSTAEPLSQLIGIPVEIYKADDSTFISQLRSNNKRKILIVGHSNTVDDIINGLTGEMALSDLPETQYGDLFIIQKKGTRYIINKERFGN